MDGCGFVTVTVTSIGTVSKKTLENWLRNGAESVWALLSRNWN